MVDASASDNGQVTVTSPRHVITVAVHDDKE